MLDDEQGGVQDDEQGGVQDDEQGGMQSGMQESSHTTGAVTGPDGELQEV